MIWRFVRLPAGATCSCGHFWGDHIMTCHGDIGCCCCLSSGAARREARRVLRDRKRP